MDCQCNPLKGNDMIQEYYRAAAKSDALNKVKAGYIPIGGGTYLSQHQEGISTVVDLQDLGLNEIKADAGTIVIGASTTFRELFENDLIPVSLKMAIQQELKINLRNLVTVAGHLCITDGFSIIQGWLYAAGVKIHIYPEGESIPLQAISNPKELAKEGFIESFSIEKNTDVHWNTISRTPDDISLVGVILGQQQDQNIRVVLAGFNEHVNVLSPINKGRIMEQVKDFLLNAHSQYSNKFISYNYYFKNSITLLERILKDNFK